MGLVLGLSPNHGFQVVSRAMFGGVADGLGFDKNIRTMNSRVNARGFQGLDLLDVVAAVQFLQPLSAGWAADGAVLR